MNRRYYMGLKTAIGAFTKIFAITLLVTCLVTFLWNLFFHGAGKIDWETSFLFAILFGITIPIVDFLKRRA
jgi:uncharacterized membrane protein YphA (DoxX/SURF4 family)